MVGSRCSKQLKTMSKEINKKLKIIGVTVLTSFSNSTIKKIGHSKIYKRVW